MVQQMVHLKMKLQKIVSQNLSKMVKKWYSNGTVTHFRGEKNLVK